MGKYITKFETQALFDEAKDNLDKLHVSLTVDNNTVHYLKQQTPQPVVSSTLVPTVNLPASGNRSLSVDVTSDVSLSQADISSHLRLTVEDSSTSPSQTRVISEWNINEDLITATVGAVTVDITAPTWPTQLFNLNLSTGYSLTLMEINWDD